MAAERWCSGESVGTDRWRYFCPGDDDAAPVTEHDHPFLPFAPPTHSLSISLPSPVLFYSIVVPAPVRAPVWKGG